MRILCTFCGILLSILTALAPLSLQAAESDTHFRAVYSLARMNGLSHEYALYISKLSQGVDEGILTSAFLFSNQRQMNHMHGDVSPTLEYQGLKGTLQRFVRQKFALAERNHALGSFAIHWGLKLGWSWLFGYGIHHLVDTYYHAGFSAATGHAESEHSPDDPSKDPAKALACIRAINEAMKAARNSVDSWGHDFKTAIKILNPIAKEYHLISANTSLTEKDFDDTSFIGDLITKERTLRDLYMTDAQKDPEYQRAAFKKIWGSLVRSGVIDSHIKFEDFFPEDLIQNSNLDVKDGLKIALRNEFIKLYNGLPSAIDLDRPADQNSKMVLYLRDNLNFDKLDVNASRYIYRLLSYPAVMKRASESQVLLDEKIAEIASKAREASQKNDHSFLEYGRGEHFDQTEEAKSLNNDVAIGQIEDMELMKNLTDETRSATLKNLEMISRIAVLQPKGTKSVMEAARGNQWTRLKLPADVSPEQVQAALNQIQILARDLAANQTAEQVATNFVKDFVPVKFNSWIKTQFALDGDLRAFEVMLKDEKYRHAQVALFGEDFVNKKTNLVFEMVELAKKFRMSFFKKKLRQAEQGILTEYSEFELAAIDRARQIAEEKGWVSTERNLAAKVTYSRKTRMVIPAITGAATLITLPYVVGGWLISKATDYAYRYAKRYQTMEPPDFKEAQENKEFKKFSSSSILKGILVNGKSLTMRSALLSCNKSQAAQ